MTRSKNLPVIGTIVIAAAFGIRGSLAGVSDASAAAKPKNWAHVQVVSYASGLTGFFDTSSGRLYLYGSDLKTPYMASEIQSLGEPLKVIKAPPGQ
jgi:hypothetical protein